MKVMEKHGVYEKNMTMSPKVRRNQQPSRLIDDEGGSITGKSIIVTTLKQDDQKQIQESETKTNQEMSAMTLLNQCLELQEQEINSVSLKAISKMNFPSSTSVQKITDGKNSYAEMQAANVILITNK